MGFLRYLWRFLFWALIVIVILATVLPLIPSSRWYIRLWDYPRLQTFFLALIALILYFIFHYKHRKRGLLLMLVLMGIVVYQAVKAFPYTPLAPKQVYASEGDLQDTTFLSMLIANVLQYNEQYESLLELVEEQQPDVIVTLESDMAWQQALDQLEGSYPHTVKVPLANTYGMHLYSRLPLKEVEVMYLLEPDIPSIRAKVHLPSGVWVQLYAVHPRPPVPGESGDSRERDAEIVLIGKMAQDAQRAGKAVVVAGDFNDVAWSSTTKLFQEVSGLLDPRIGRGFYNTFHAQYPLLRWPLDHVFHSSHFKLKHMERLPGIGSDHFPIMISLSHEPEEKAEQPMPLADEDTEEEASEKIQKGVNDSDSAGQ